MDKIVFNDSWDYGTDLPLATIADDPMVLRKCASSVSDGWGKIDPIKGHTLIHLIALGAHEKTGRNRNADSWREKVLRQKHGTFKTHGSLYHNHLAEEGKEEGFVHKTAFNEDMGRAELIIAANNDKCAAWLGDVEKGKPVSFSMGFKCTHPGDECSICGNFAAKREDYCKHLKKNASAPYGLNRILPDGRACFAFNDAGFFNDISKVPIGADQIAMGLRKVASLSSDEVIGGAELAEQYFIHHSDVDHGKVAIVLKLADIEKRIESIGTGIKGSRKRLLCKVAMDKLREAPTKEMFLELSKLGAILPMVDFYKLVFGSEFVNHERAINKAASYEANFFLAIAADKERLHSVCSNTTYDPAPISHVRLDYESKRAIAAEYSIDIELAAERAIKRAALLDSIPPANTISSQDNYLIDQYGAYKISALKAISPEVNDEILFASLI